MVDPANEKLAVFVSTVPMVFGKLVPLKVKPNRVGLELNPPEKEPKVIPVIVTVSARATP
jgi:hypothetical protein